VGFFILIVYIGVSWDLGRRRGGEKGGLSGEAGPQEDCGRCEKWHGTHSTWLGEHLQSTQGLGKMVFIAHFLANASVELWSKFLVGSSEHPICLLTKGYL
jgi:hypothetical protein